MGNFVQHLTGSVVAGAACAVGATYLFHAQPIDAAACAALCAIGGLIPDIDSPVSKPADFIVSISSAVAPVFTLQMFTIKILEASEIFLIALSVFFGARIILREVIKRCTVHRGMVHSIPAAIIWGSLVFLAFRHSPPIIQNLAAASAVIGFVTHLLIDEMFSLVDISGAKLSPKSSSGTAFKLFGSSIPVTVAIYFIVAFMLYLCAVDAGFIQDVWGVKIIEKVN